jgi:hypothetical protein
MPLAINWFRAAMSAETQTLPAKEFPTADAAREILRGVEMRGITLHWFQSPGTRAVTLIALNGIDGKTPQWESSVFSINQHDQLFAHIVEISLASYFATRGNVKAFRDRWGVEALREDEELKHPAVRLFQGVTANCQSDDEGKLGVIFNWRVRGEFHISLANPQIASRAIDAPVELRVNTTTWPLAVELKRFNGRYLGKVTNIRGRIADVTTRHGERARVPTEYLFFEGSAQRIRDYETSFMKHGRTVSAWTRMQQLSFGLTPQGKRNASMFRDRLHAIVEFVGMGADFVVCETNTYAAGQVTIDLQPRRLSTEAPE